MPLGGLDQDVEIADGPEVLGGRLQGLAKGADRLAAKVRGDDTKGRALTSGGDAHAMKRFNVASLDGALLVRPHDRVVKLEHPTPGFGHRLIAPDVRTLPPWTWRHHRVEQP